ncbi:hypothetical protein BSR29_03510 [Boudabousia liubingyangii]|uniref:Oxidoreductase n=1 Tax=Boudabousia liubingyangii TaxID=1921764 RepID=A0A1Q5PMY7_9ACTO|nr:Gfo/Idh/MocA family oxidoreductase [Boudabousia liubingyangii]OKL48921.1 hypothetical protein BSR29_03510 [Boudabousia liubingyangii]
MSEKTLKIAVIGLGARSALATKALGPKQNCELVAAVEPSPKAKERLAQRIGLEVPIFSSVEELRDIPLDAAFVTSPDDTHAQITIELLNRGVAVYLEKPLAIKLEDATAILQTAYRTKTPLYLGHNMRHMQVVRGLKRIIDEGLIGPVKAIWCRHFVGSGGDFYFKDWHAQREHVGGLLLQKAAHDIDVMHWLANGHATRVVGMGGLTLYGDLEARGGQGDKLMPEWHSLKNWPPRTQTGLADQIDVEDLSMMLMELNNGVFCSYQQCHYTPDYWRNYTVIGEAGRAENFGDGEGGVIRVWNQRRYYSAQGDLEFPIEGDANGHDDADQLTVNEFLDFVRYGTPTDTNPLGAWWAVAAGIGATDSIRQGNQPVAIDELPTELCEYFLQGQPGPR